MIFLVIVRSVAAAVMVAAAGVAPAAQDGQALLPIYRDAVRNYQATRTLEGARALVGAWTREDFEAVTAAEARMRDRARVEAAAVFHLEIALGVAPAAPDGALLHVRLGERLLRDGVLASPEARAPGGTDFVSRWYVTAASVFLAQTDTVRARSVVEHGLAGLPESAALRHAAGVVEELEALQFEPDRAQDASGSQRRMLSDARTGMEAATRLTLAERAYRHAVRLDPAMAAARLRLGRVLSLLGRLDEAETALAAALADASAPAERVLAGLFLSEVHAQLGEIETARGLLEDVRDLQPGSQIAWLALAQLEEREGRPDLARALVREGLGQPPPLTDPWADYRNGALDLEGLAWLRSRVAP